MRRRSGLGKGILTVTMSVVVMLGVAGTAVAVPPPPPNPSDAELNSGKAEVNSKAGKVGELTNQLAEAESRLINLQSDVELKMEEANQALVDLQTAQDAALAAEENAAAASREADAAGQDIENARGELDDFAAGSYQQSSTLGSMSAYLGASSPEDLLQRAQLLDSVSSSRLDAMDDLQRARVQKANKDSTARAKLALANQKRAEAQQAKRNADAATARAEQAQRDQATQNAQIETEKAGYEEQLSDAQAKVTGLQSQRQQYQNWLAAKQKEDAERAKEVASSGGGGNGGGGHATTVRPIRGNASAVINRALSQLGVIYVWGGGNAGGPTRGLPGISGIGFDCSGLMIYAFAAAGVRLPHYSGYQATAGRRVPLSQMAPGDMLFWATAGRIHHVALYIGNGQMVEAPHTGARVRIVSVRYGGIVPYATRLL